MTGTNTQPRDNPGILVVEDERDLADLYAEWLDDIYPTEVAYSGSEALDTIGESTDIVFLDRRMPDLDGDEVLKEIRARDLDTRVAMLTAVIPDFDIIEMGFDEYLTKPVTKADLLETIDRLHRRSSYEEQVNELYTLASKQATLKAQKRPDELENSEEFAKLQAEVTTAKEQLRTKADDIDDADFRVLMEGLSTSRSGSE